MFEQLEAAPPDAILGLNEAFARDTTEGKINLTTGVYKDAGGTTPVLACVKEAERRLVETESSKGYLGIDGMPDFGDAARQLLFGADHEITSSGRAATIQAPGGTGALRVAAEFLATAFPGTRIWGSQPTWPNHPNIFRAAGLELGEYAYYNAESRGLDAPALFDSLAQIPEGDIVCLHACCHNPTGVDPSPEQWQQVADIVAERRLLPLVDFAYQGFGDGLEEDAVGLRALAKPGSRLLVASSFSKNFGLYRERVGSLTVVTGSPETASIVLSRLKRTIRCNYSNPPAHGASTVTTVLADDSLRSQWESELADMRNRINDMRIALAEGLAAAAPDHDFSFITRQRGMFSFSGLTAEQVDRLKEEHGVYMVRNGRINVAGVTSDNVGRLCESIAKVL
mgnify:CR=1 FL=1